MSWLALLLATSTAASWVTTTGYVDSRTTAAATQFNGAPGLTELFEGNVQLKLAPHEKVTFFSDASLFWQQAWLIHGGEKDISTSRPAAVVSEAYVDLPLQEHFRLLLGKKRLVWGSGLSFNPTDALNPPKDPTDPTSQRAGAWLAEAEWGFERAALSLVFATRATRQYAGLPTALMYSPDLPTAEVARGIAADERDNDAHYAFSGRLYLLLADIDINFIYAFTNLYTDAFQNKSKFGLSVSRVFGSWEVHAEAMLYNGSSRPWVPPECADAPMSCIVAQRPLISRPHLDASWLNARALAGARYQFEDGALFAVEYFFNGEGQNASGFQSLAQLVVTHPLLVQQALAGSVDPGTPQKFTLEALRRHYLVLQASKPQLWDDWTLSVFALIGLEDLSMQWVPQVQWMPQDWLQLALSAYIPVAGLSRAGVNIAGVDYGQFTLSPFQTRVMLQARAYF